MTTLKVLSAGAMKPALSALAPAFGAARGVEVALSFGPAPEVSAKARDASHDFSVVIGPDAVIGALVAEGRVHGEDRVGLGGVKAAVAVHRDAPAPDLATPDAVREAVRAASAIVYNTASSGQYIDAMIRGLGIAEEVEPRVRRYPDAAEAMRFLGSPEGRTAIGFGQSSAIRGYESQFAIRLAGALPDAIGNVTAYVGTVATTAPQPELARAFLTHLASGEGRAALAATGVQ